MNPSSRYARQTVLPEIGPEGQDKLAAARILVVGAGGLGCPALLYLAGAGVGGLSIIDFDRVSLSNLHRQILFTTHDEGHPKAQVARQKLRALNPDITIHARTETLTPQNALTLFADHDLVVDGTDSFAAKYLINDAALKTGKPVVHGAIQGFEGRVSVFNHAGGPCYRCLYPHPPKAAIRTCAENGVVGALPGIVGSLQAMEAIKLVVAHPSFEPLSGKLWTIDAATMETRTLNFRRSKDCPACSMPPEDIVLAYDAPLCTSTLPQVISYADARRRNALFVDVRENTEWTGGHIDGAIHLPLSGLQNSKPWTLTKEGGRICVLYCHSGFRSRKAAEILTACGVEDLYVLNEAFEDLPAACE